MALTKEQIKEFKKLEEKAENNTARCADYIDEFEYYYGELAQDLGQINRMKLQNWQ